MKALLGNQDLRSEVKRANQCPTETSFYEIPIPMEFVRLESLQWRPSLSSVCEMIQFCQNLLVRAKHKGRGVKKKERKVVIDFSDLPPKWTLCGDYYSTKCT